MVSTNLGKREWQPTPVFLPGESHGPTSLAGYSPRGCRVGHDWVTKHTHTPNKRLSATPSETCIHSFIITPSLLRASPLPSANRLRARAFQSDLTSQWSCFSGALSSFTPKSPSVPFLLSFPSQRQFFISEENLWKLLKHALQSETLFFFLTFGGELLPTTPQKREPCQRRCIPPLTFMQCSESAGVSALTNLHLFECDAWKKPEPLD